MHIRKAEEEKAKNKKQKTIKKQEQSKLKQMKLLIIWFCYLSENYRSLY